MGTRGDVDMCLWSIGYAVDELNRMRSELMRDTARCGYLTSPHNFLAMTKRSQYQIDREDESEGASRGAIRPGGQKYIFIYPFLEDAAVVSAGGCGAEAADGRAHPHWAALSAGEAEYDVLVRHRRPGVCGGVRDELSRRTSSTWCSSCERPRSVMYTLQDTPIFSCVAGVGERDARAFGVVGAARKASSVVKVAVSGAKRRTAAKVRRKPLDPARVAAILRVLAETYPGVVCALQHRQRVGADGGDDPLGAVRRMHG